MKNIMNTLALQLKMAILGGKGKPSPCPVKVITAAPTPPLSITNSSTMAQLHHSSTNLWRDTNMTNLYAGICADINKTVFLCECGHLTFYL